MHFSVSAPILVGRRKGYYWFPTLMPLADGSLLVSAYDDLDAYSGRPMGLYSWSGDGGHTWTQPVVRAPFSECGLALDSGDHLLLPYRLYPDPGGAEGMAAPATLVPFGQCEIRTEAREVRITGWPRPPLPQGDAARGEEVTGGFVFNGQVVRLADGAFYATLYGTFAGDSRYSLVGAVSENGLNWSVRSVIAGANCALPGGEGPCEAALARLRDGRLLCVFRMDGNFENVYDPDSPLSARPYGLTYSTDEGRTWSTPAENVTPAGGGALPGPTRPGSVQPGLAVLPGGTVVLCGGRPGLYLWWTEDDFRQPWESFDILAHHNACCPEESIRTAINTSSYMEVLALSDSRLIVVYDRLPWGWKPVPADARQRDNPAESNSVWVIHIDLHRADRAATMRRPEFRAKNSGGIA